MKIAALALGFTALALGAFAVWTFGYRSDSHGGRAAAVLDAQQIAELGKVGPVLNVTKVRGSQWLATLNASDQKACVVIDLRRFEIVTTSSGWQAHGTGTTACR